MTSATGGAEFNAGGYRYHVFTANDSLVIAEPGAIDVLLVGGGGGGGHDGAGGGGGGQVLMSMSRVTGAGTYPLTIGAGGAKYSGVGGNTTGFDLTAIGGGGGGAKGTSGTTGASGGGAGHGGGAGSPGTYGYGGGAASSNSGGGGGGAGADGSPGGSNGGAGGIGVQAFNGTWYGGGGGGGSWNNGGGTGGTGGGGNGNGGNAVANTGGGGGGSGEAVQTTPGSGGSGIAVIRYVYGAPVVSNATLISQIQSDSPTAFWPLLGDQATAVLDSTSNGRNLTYALNTGTPQFGTKQIIQGATPGWTPTTYDYFTAENGAWLAPGAGDWCVSFFYNGNTINPGQTFDTVWSHDTADTGNGTIIYIPNGGDATYPRGVIRLWFAGSVYQSTIAQQGGVQLLDGRTHHVVVERRSGQISFYIDGNRVLGPSANTATPSSLTSAPYIGTAYSGSATYRMRNSVAFFAIWSGGVPIPSVARLMSYYDRALTPENEYQKIVLRDGPKLFMPLNERTGAKNALALAGSSDGVYNGSPGLEISGPSAIDLTAAQMVSGSSVSTGLTTQWQPFSAECWFKWDGTVSETDDHEIISKRSYFAGVQADFPFSLAVLNGDSKLHARVSNGGDFNFDLDLISPSTIPVGVWQHAVFTHVSGGTSRLYLNGVEVATGTGPNMSTGTQDWQFGRISADNAGGAGRGNFNGALAAPALYDYELSPSQIAQHYIASPSAFKGLSETTLPAGCLLHLPLDDRGGSTAVATVGRNATYLSAPTRRVTGPSSKLPFGITVDGTDDAVSGNYAMSSNEYSYEIWARIDSLPTSGMFWKHGGAANVNTAGVGLGVGNGTGSDPATAGSLLVALYEGNRWINTGVTLTTGWHHFVMTIQISPSVARFYVDGLLVFTDTGTTLTGPLSLLQVGGYNSTTPSDRFFGGGLAGFSWYNRVLTDAEIYERYAITGGLRHANTPVRY